MRIAMFQGYGDLGAYRDRRRRRKTHSRRRVGGRRGQRSKFAKAAKSCSRKTRAHGGSFRACMRKMLKGR